MNKYPIQNKEKLSKNYTVYDFQDNFDERAIKKAIKNSKDKMPLFYLSKIEIHPSGTCNQNCKICYGRFLAPEKRANLSSKDIKSLFFDIRKNMPDENPLIILSGLYSEPLTNPEIKEILRYVGKYKFRYGLYTNGLLIDDEIIQILLKNSLNTQDNCSFISFNVTSSLLSGDFEKLIQRMKRLSDKRKIEPNYRLQINAPILILKPNYKYIKSIIKKLVAAGVDIVRLSIPWPQHIYNGKLTVKKTILNNDYKKTVELIEKLHENFPDKIKIRYDQSRKSFDNCYVMAMTSAISPEGDIYPCPETCSPFFSHLSYGNIKKNKFSEVWQGLKHQEIFKSLNPPKNGCVCCPVDLMFNKLCENIYQNS